MRLSTAVLVPAAMALSLLLAPPGLAAEGTGGISGTVTSAATGASISGLRVTAFATTRPASGSGIEHAVTASDGSYTITGLAAGYDYTVEFLSNSSLYADENFRDAHVGQTPTLVRVIADVTVTGIDAAMDPGGVISGHVWSGSVGIPMAGVSVCAIAALADPVTAWCHISQSTGTAGAYMLFGLLPGDYWVRFTPPSPAPPQFYPQSMDAAGASLVTVRAEAITESIDTIVATSTPDTTPPEISMFSIAPIANDQNWYRAPVSITWHCADRESGVVDEFVTTTIDTEGIGVRSTGACVDRAGNRSPETTAGFNIDLTDPVITHDSTLPVANAAGWSNASVTATWTCTDALSGPVTTSVSATTSGSGSGMALTGTCADNAARTASAMVSGINVDLVAPSLTWAGDIDDGDSFLFGTLPTAPTCTAVDGLSGPDGCQVTGYATSVGEHTLVARALDRAGNASTEHRAYTVRPWTMLGFRAPVSMGEWNVMRAGASIPVKFEVFADATELTSLAAVAGVSVGPIPCSTISTRMARTAAPVSGLHYDAKGGYFAVDLKLPKAAGTCVSVSATAADGSTLSVPIALR